MNTIIHDSNVYIPEKVVMNDFYERKFQLAENWITQRTGIQSRHLAKENESTSDLAVQAIEPLLSRNHEAIEFLICATSTPDSLLPSTANKICKKLNLHHSIVCFDVMAACSGFLYALSIANAFISSGLYKSGIIVGAEKMSAIINQEDPYTCALFGDGAGAFLLKNTPEKEKGILSTSLNSDSTGIDKLFIKAGGAENPLTADSLKNKENYVTMIGKDVFVNAVKRMTESINDVMEKSNLSFDDLDFIIPHQANARITDTIYKKLGSPESVQLLSIIKENGNIVNASIPTTYHLNKALFFPDKNLIMVAFGAGFNYGALHIST